MTRQLRAIRVRSATTGQGLGRRGRPISLERGAQHLIFPRARSWLLHICPWSSDLAYLSTGTHCDKTQGCVFGQTTTTYKKEDKGNRARVQQDIFLKAKQTWYKHQVHNMFDVQSFRKESGSSRRGDVDMVAKVLMGRCTPEPNGTKTVREEEYRMKVGYVRNSLVLLIVRRMCGVSKSCLCYRWKHVGTMVVLEKADTSRVCNGETTEGENVSRPPAPPPPPPHSIRR